MSAAVQPLPRAAVNAKLVSLLASAAVGLGVLLSGFVLREPAPYEIYMAGLIGVWALFGLRIPAAAVPMTVLLVVFNIGGMISITQMADLFNAPLYMAVSLFLAFTAIFYACVVTAQPDLYRLIFVCWTVAAVATALLGILGYFGVLPGSEMFTRYSRAAGAFEDPNVFGPYLALPGIFLLHRLMTGPVSRMPLLAIPLLIVAGGVFLSFSRGAWGLFGLCSMLLIACLFLQSASGLLRLRIVVMAMLALLLLALAIVVILQIPAVADLFSERARLTQDYDSARLGRFARFGIGFAMATEHPLGIGPLTFGRLFGEDTHNIWLKALMDYGWLGFACYLLLIVWTLAAGFRILFRNRPWQIYFLCSYIVLLGHVLLGSVIDTDHWRHFYLLLGLVWAGIALEARHQHEVAQRPRPVSGFRLTRRAFRR